MNNQNKTNEQLLNELQLLREENNSLKTIIGKEKLMSNQKIDKENYIIKQNESFEFAIKESEKEFRNLIELSPVAMVIIHEWKTIYFNPAALQLFGAKSLSEVVNMSILDFVHPDGHKIVYENYEILTQKGYVPKHEQKYLKLDGSILDVEPQANTIRFNNENATLVVINDITESKKSESALKESEERYKSLLQYLETGIVVHAPDSSIIMSNPKASELLGLTNAQMLGKVAIDPDWKFVNVDNTKMLLENYPVQQIINTKKAIKDQILGIQKTANHTIIWVNVNGFPVLDNNGEITEVVISFIDITERKLSEESLRKSKDRLNRAEFASKSGNWELLVDAGIIKASKGACSIYGLQRENFNYENILQIPFVEYRQKLDLALKNLIENNVPYDIEFKIKTADTDEVKDIHSSAVYDADRKVVFGVIQDITDRKKAENALRESEERFKVLFEKAPDAMFLADRDTRKIVDANIAASRLFKKEKNELIGIYQYELHPEKANSKSVEDFDIHSTLSINTERTIPIENTILTSEGNEIPVEILGQAIKIGEKDLLLGTFRDITERKIAEIALKESEEKFRILFAENPQPMFVYNINTFNILEVNQTALNFYGYTKEECLKMSIKELHPSEDIQSFLEIMEQTKMGINTDGITKHIKKNGEIITVEIFSAAANFWGEDARLALVVDITERKMIENVNNFLITCGMALSQENFFESLAKYLSQILEMEYVCIDTLDGDGLTAHTVAIYNDGVFDTNVSYTLKETPCGKVVGKTICCYPENVCNLFPHDAALRDLNAESYVGATLWSFDNKAIGLIAIIGRKPLKNPIMANNILRLVSVRASGELERKKGEEALIKKNADLDYMNKFMVNREVRMADMKKEVNELLVSMGKEKRYL